MKQVLPILSIVLFSAFTAQAQTNPEPFDLSQGDYVFENWPDVVPAGTYPSNMMFHVYGTENNNPGVDEPIVGDWVCRYDIESRSRILGMGENGFSFLNTGNTQDSQERCGAGPDDVGGYVGAATLALNTTGMEMIMVNYIATKLTVGSGEPPREYILRLEYRVGTQGDFMALEESTLSSDLSDIDDPEEMSIQLPADASNQAVVHIRWRYYQAAENDGGQRPQWQVGSINVSGSVISSTADMGAANALSAFPNPSTQGPVTFSENVNATLYDLTGKVLLQINNSNILNISGFQSGMYLLKSDDGRVLKLIRD